MWSWLGRGLRGWAPESAGFWRQPSPNRSSELFRRRLHAPTSTHECYSHFGRQDEVRSSFQLGVPAPVASVEAGWSPERSASQYELSSSSVMTRQVLPDLSYAIVSTVRAMRS
jgi:hypothetical protein